MVTCIRYGLPIIGFLTASLACEAQDVRRTVTPFGSLSGSVYCADTNQPARLASIYLIRISDAGIGSESRGQTDLDGRFALSHVEEGDYYVAAVLPGYLNIMSSLTKPHLDAMAVEERKRLLAQMVSVTVSARQAAQVAVRLERGVEIDGTVSYDDGSPAIGLRVSYKLKTAEGKNNDGAQSRIRSDLAYSTTGQPTTDDQGHFRILGAPPGEYLVHVTIPTNSSQAPEDDRVTSMIEYPFNQMDIYVGGGLRPSKAETIKVDAGGAKEDADITIPLSKLHTVRGQVLLKSTGQPPVVANVQLLYFDTHEELRTVIARNGKFEFFYVPEEKFLVRAAAGSDPPPTLDSIDGPNAPPGPHHVVWSFPQAGADSPAIPLQVTGDVDNLTIAVPDPAPNKKGPTIEIDRGGGTYRMQQTLPQ